jgi:hypothetical protein
LIEIDFATIRSGQKTYADIVRNLTYVDLRSSTEEFFDTIDTILAGANDAAVTFVPVDPAKSDGEEGWSLNHVLTHLTATLEEAAAVASAMARGVNLEARLRYEVPFETMQTAQQVQARLQESRRMCRGFFDTWPDQPHLDIQVTRFPALGPMNAIGLYALGFGHGQSHLEQLREIVRQAKV